MMKPIRSVADIRNVEAQGLAALCPHGSPQKILEASARAWPDRTAIHYLTDPAAPENDRRWSFADLYADIQAAARVFRAYGVVAGKSVAILGNHTPSAQIALWGAQLAGRACPINPLLRAEHIAVLFDAAQVEVAVVMGRNHEQDYWQALVPALREAGVGIPIFDCDAGEDSAGSSGSFEALLRQEHGRAPQIDVGAGFIDGDDDAIAALYHTGGTTGTPKLVRHTRLNEAHVARSCALLHGYGPEDVVVNGFPLFHVAGAFVYGLSVLSSGATLVVPGRLGMRNTAFIGDFWRQAERLGVTAIGCVPTLLAGLMARPVDADVSRIRVALTGGSPLPPELADGFETRTGIPVRNIFGMTETAGSIALESVHADRQPLCCGFPLPFSQVVIVPYDGDEIDMSQPLPAGQTGIVAVRGPNVSPGYTDHSRNAGTFLDGGWLLTGDLGRLDDSGRLYLTGRAKDVIIRGSHNIDPQSIEDALLAHPDIELAAAVGMPDNYAGELPVAFVSVREGSAVSSNDVLAFLVPRIEEPAALPKRIEIIEVMPLTPVGKIFKPQLRRQAFRWAIADAVAAAGVANDQVSVEVDDNLAVRLTVAEPDAERIRQHLVGMPIAFTLIEKRAD